MLGIREQRYSCHCEALRAHLEARHPTSFYTKLCECGKGKIFTTKKKKAKTKMEVEEAEEEEKKEEEEEEKNW